MHLVGCYRQRSIWKPVLTAVPWAGAADTASTGGRDGRARGGRRHAGRGRDVGSSGSGGGGDAWRRDALASTFSAEHHYQQRQRRNDRRRDARVRILRLAESRRRCGQPFQQPSTASRRAGRRRAQDTQQKCQRHP